MPSKGEGRYLTFLKEAKVVNPNMRIVGFTATPFRLSGGLICKPENMLNEICYSIGIKQLIDDGYLCPLVTKGSRVEFDTSSLHIRAGEFIKSEMDELMSNRDKVRDAVDEMIEYTEHRNSTLVFASSIDHGDLIRAEIESHGHECKAVYGDTPRS